MKDERKLPFRENPHLVPEELENLKFECGDCGEKLEVDWVKNMEYPATPIQCNDGKAVLLPVSVPVECLNLECGKRNNINVPKKPIKGGMSLFGDEAARDVKVRKAGELRDARFACITLAYLTLEKHEEFKRRFNEIKLLARPDVPPESWVHHFSDIWNTHSDSPSYSFSSLRAKISYAKKIAALIKSYNPYLALFNYSSCIVFSDGKSRSKEVGWQNEDLFKQSIIISLRDIRSAGYVPKWFFDNVKDRKSESEAAIEGWASECFLGIQYSRLYTWLSAGGLIDEPKFLVPGSHFLLEISDFVCFWIARGFMKRLDKSKPEISPDKLGMLNCYGTNGKGEVLQYSSYKGFPYKEIYGL